MYGSRAGEERGVIWVCVCVCEREREREKRRFSDGTLFADRSAVLDRYLETHKAQVG